MEGKKNRKLLNVLTIVYISLGIIGAFLSLICVFYFNYHQVILAAGLPISLMLLIMGILLALEMKGNEKPLGHFMSWMDIFENKTMPIVIELVVFIVFAIFIIFICLKLPEKTMLWLLILFNGYVLSMPWLMRWLKLLFNKNDREKCSYDIKNFETRYLVYIWAFTIISLILDIYHDNVFIPAGTSTALIGIKDRIKRSKKQ